MMVSPKASQNMKSDGSRDPDHTDFMLLALIEPLAISIHPIASVFVRLG
jgi:hypothetical protein